RERLEEEVVEGLPVGEAFPELGGLGLELGVAEALVLRLEGVDVGHQTLKGAELLALPTAKDAVEDAHTGGRAYRTAPRPPPSAWSPARAAGAVLSAVRQTRPCSSSRGNGGVARGRTAMRTRTRGLSSPAQRFRWTSPQPVQRWTSTH